MRSAPVYGLSAIVFIIAGIIAITAASYKTLIVHRAPFDRPPAVLADRAQTYLDSFGYRERAVGYGERVHLRRRLRALGGAHAARRRSMARAVCGARAGGDVLVSHESGAARAERHVAARACRTSRRSRRRG